MASPAGSMQRSHGSSSAASLKRSAEARSEPSVPVETLVTHLLAAKRSLSSMNHVLRANEIATACRSAHEDACILAAQTAFLRNATHDQAGILVRIRRSLQATYDWGSKDFKRLVRAMDEVDGDLERTIEMLRGTAVQSALRPKGEESRFLLDFVDEDSVDGMRQAMKKSIQELQGIQQSFDGDLLRFDTDIRSLKKAISDSSAAADEGNNAVDIPEVLHSVVENSSSMAQLLASLTTHFDMCVTAIRTTEGGAALARHRAAESQNNPDGVSISGVIAEQESNAPDLEPKTERDRAEMLRVVVQDANEVDDVVREMQERLAAMEQDHNLLVQRRDASQTAYTAILEAYAVLSGIADRLNDYLASENDFKTRWDLEKDSIFSRLGEMKDMRGFYEGYASAYDGLLLEIERRKAVHERVKAIWRTAQESVDKLLDGDSAAREAFRQDVGEFLPTDLWPGMHLPPKRWKVTRVKDKTESEN